ncbi:MAG: hypothetical protein RI580_12025 [Halothece sp. Uz-M2-17]|nr:hypothetical protein [Halothece sp. Uz-M2-17]
MSSVSNSDSDRAFKSRILNFLNRQWLQFGDRAKIGLRQLQTATVWGMQILAYPLYLLVQTSTVVSKQLQNKAVKLLSPAKEQETASVASQPTAVILNSLHHWLEGTPYQLFPLPQTRRSLGEKLQFWRKQQPASTSSPAVNFPTTSQQQGLLQNLSFLSNLSKKQSNPTQHYLIQGIATYLETGKLVLVTTENQAIDLLSDAQHEQLKQRMKILLECYEQLQQPWWWRVVSESEKGGLRPLRWFSKLIIWIQTSPLAKRLNWFQESQLRFSSGYEDISQVPPFPPETGILDQLDRALSRWENTQLSPVIDKIRHWKTTLDQKEDPNAILSIIRSAVDYFYGVNADNRLTGDAPKKETPKLLQPVYRLIEQGKGRIQNSTVSDGMDQDPFTVQQLIQAAMDYFFEKPDPNSAHSLPDLDISSEPWLERADLFGEKESSQALPPTSPSKEQKEDFPVVVSRYLTAPAKTKTKEEETEADNPSDWLQTEAVSMGYEKHILARILEWLDRALVWLEEKFLQIWTRVKQFRNRSR